MLGGRALPEDPFTACADIAAEIASRLPPQGLRQVFPLGISAFDAEHLLCEFRKLSARRKRKRSPDASGLRRETRLRRLATCAEILGLRRSDLQVVDRRASSASNASLPELQADGASTPCGRSSLAERVRETVLLIARLESELNRARARLSFWRALERDEKRARVAHRA